MNTAFQKAICSEKCFKRHNIIEVHCQLSSQFNAVSERPKRSLGLASTGIGTYYFQHQLRLILNSVLVSVVLKGC